MRRRREGRKGREPCRRRRPPRAARTSWLSPSQLASRWLERGRALGLRWHRDQGARDRIANVEMLGGDASDVVSRNPGDDRGPVVDLLNGLTEQSAFGIAPGERALAVRLIDELGDERLFGAVKLARRHALLAQLVEHAVHAGLDLAEVDTLGGHRVDADAAAVEA